jgi:hypothetical protein
MMTFIEFKEHAGTASTCHNQRGQR